MRNLFNLLIFVLLLIFGAILTVCIIEDQRRRNRQMDYKMEQHQMELKEWRIKYLPEVYDENGNKRQ